LNPVDKEQPTKEFVDWGGEAAKEEVRKCHPKTFGRVRHSFIARDPGQLAVREQAHLLELA
jgi:hypothetical protein